MSNQLIWQKILCTYLSLSRLHQLCFSNSLFIYHFSFSLYCFKLSWDIETCGSLGFVPFLHEIWKKINAFMNFIKKSCSKIILNCGLAAFALLFWIFIHYSEIKWNILNFELKLAKNKFLCKKFITVTKVYIVNSYFINQC